MSGVGGAAADMAETWWTRGRRRVEINNENIGSLMGDSRIVGSWPSLCEVGRETGTDGEGRASSMVLNDGMVSCLGGKWWSVNLDDRLRGSGKLPRVRSRRRNIRVRLESPVAPCMPAYIQLLPTNWRGSTMAIHTAVCLTTMVDYEAKQVYAGQRVERFNRSRRTELGCRYARAWRTRAATCAL